jgi:hypothetical protein
MSERAGASDSLRDREPALPATPSADEHPQPPHVNDVAAAFVHADSLEPLVRQVLSTLGC